MAREAAGFAVRSLAVKALAWTGAAVSVLTSAHAVTLGDVAVDSALGQPLRARVPFVLGPGEVMGTTCVSAPSSGSAELGNLPQPILSVPEAAVPGTYDLRITTTQPLYEPMYELQLQVRCTGTPLLVRQYVLMLDLPGADPPLAAPPVAVNAAMPVTANGAEVQSATNVAPGVPVAQRPPHPRQAVKLGAPIAPGSRYRVSAGDTLSTIAARISDRGGRGIWQTDDDIFAANPAAFVGGNQDLIKLGSEIAIPLAADAPPATPQLPTTTAAQSAAPTEIVESEAAPTASAATDAAAQDTDVPKPGGLASNDAPAEPASDKLLPPSTAPVFQDEQATPPALEPPAAAASPEVSSRVPDRSAPPWLAALVALLIGAGASLVLLRDRLVQALRGLFAHRSRVVMSVTGAMAVTPRLPAGPPQISRPMVAREPSMVVIEESQQDADETLTARIDQTDRTPALAPAVSQSLRNTGLDSELSSLFGDESALQSFNGQNAGVLPSSEALDLDLSAATPDVAIDQDISWLGDETALTPTEKSGARAGFGGDTAEHVDLQTLSEKATDDAQLSQTLKDALNLLESDYEDELTASQVVDRSKLKEILDEADQEDTMGRTGTDHNPRR